MDWADPPVPGPYTLLDAPQMHESFLAAERQAKLGRQPVSLDACFEAFLQTEQLVGCCLGVGVCLCVCVSRS